MIHYKRYEKYKDRWLYYLYRCVVTTKVEQLKTLFINTEKNSNLRDQPQKEFDIHTKLNFTKM